jgi:flavodoxin short chain
MTKALILYYSRTGNTEKMANAIAEGIKSSGNIEVELNYHADPKELSTYDALIVGAPTYNHDMPVDFKNLFVEAAVEGISLKDKVGAVFGSYGWSGEAVKLIQKELEEAKFKMIDPGLRIQYVPDGKGIEACHELGRRIAAALPR